MTPRAGLIFATGSRTDAGRVRAHNEDACAALPELGLWVVADGMGGHAAGEVASALVIDELRSVGVAVTSEDQRVRVLERLDRAHQRIVTHADTQGLHSMGATVAALLIQGTDLACIWAGDSRIYLLRQGLLTPLTRDHSEVAEMVAEGLMTAEEARHSPRRNVITRAIGIGAAAQPELASGIVLPGDRLLLCSDGLTEHFTDDELARLLADTADPQRIADMLVALTLDRGAKDNVTVIVVDCAAAADGSDDAEG